MLKLSPNTNVTATQDGSVLLVRGDGSYFTFSPNTKVTDTYDE